MMSWYWYQSGITSQCQRVLWIKVIIFDDYLRAGCFCEAGIVLAASVHICLCVCQCASPHKKTNKLLIRNWRGTIARNTCYGPPKKRSDFGHILTWLLTFLKANLAFRPDTAAVISTRLAVHIYQTEVRMQ